MGNADGFRDRARRMLDLAQRARREGHAVYARLLAQLASEALEHASEMYIRFRQPASSPPPHSAQQQQQPQPEPPGDPEKRE